MPDGQTDIGGSAVGKWSPRAKESDAVANFGLEARSAAAAICSAPVWTRPNTGTWGDISIHGQESNDTIWRMARLSLAVRGINAQIGHVDTFRTYSSLRPHDRLLRRQPAVQRLR